MATVEKTSTHPHGGNDANSTLLSPERKRRDRRRRAAAAKSGAEQEQTVQASGVSQTKLKRIASGLDWPIVTWLAVVHLGALAAPFTFSWQGLVVLLVLHWVAGGIGVCLGYHRLLTHGSFQTPRAVRLFLAFAGGFSGEGSAIDWVANHRKHHAFSDQEGDPHSPHDGAWWSHMFWLAWLLKGQAYEEHIQRWAPDLAKDRGMRIVSNLFLPTHFVTGLVLFGAGYWFGGLALATSLLVWGLFLRMATVLHATWFVNSASHIWGYRNYTTTDDSRNNWWVALITYGEGWHNNHHAYPRMAKHGHKWWEVDVTFLTIRLMQHSAWPGMWSTTSTGTRKRLNSSMHRWSPWIPAGCMMLVSLISYIDRNTLAILAPTIRDAARMSEADYGYVISAFSIAYMLGNPIWGWVLDRFGLRVGMTAAVGFWTLASVSHAFATEFWGFAIARAALGFGEGATFPGGLRAVMQSLPPHERARGVAIAYSGGSLGAIVAPLVVTPINHYWNWQAAFLFTGLIGVTWILIWQWVARRPDIRTAYHSPVTNAVGADAVARDASPSASRSESTGQDSAAPAGAAGSQIRMGDRRVWAYMLAYALGGSPLAFILYYSASYLKQTFSLTQEALGSLLWIPPLGWEVGYFFWGWLSDRMHRSGRRPIVVERQLFLLLAVLSLPLAAVPFCSSLSEVMALKFLAMAAAAGFIIVAISYAMHVFHVSNSGLIAGLGAGAWGAGVAAMSPVYGTLFDHKQFPLAFALAALIPTFGLLLWLALSHLSRRTA